MKTVLLAALGVVCRAEPELCRDDQSVGFCPLKGCFAFLHGPSTCRRFHCWCNPGYCSIDGKHCILRNSTAKDTSVPTPSPGTTTTASPVTTIVRRRRSKRPMPKVPYGVKAALLVVGTEPDQPLYADAIFKKKLEHHGFDVILIKDNMVTDAYCEQFDIMLVSASIDGNAVKDSLNSCSRPSMHWEMGLWLYNGMTGPKMGVDAWLTHENRFARVPKGPTGAWPPRPQGGNIYITKEGAEFGELAAGLGPGEVPFFEDGFYGMNWASVDSLGSGAQIVGILPMPTAPKPQEDKAVLFYYPKGAELAGDHGPSPGLRIGFTPFHYSHGTDPTCEELSEAQQSCNGCSKCQTAAEMEASVKPMPLTEEGLQILDDAIRMLNEDALTGTPKRVGQESNAADLTVNI